MPVAVSHAPDLVVKAEVHAADVLGPMATDHRAHAIGGEHVCRAFAGASASEQFALLTLLLGGGTVDDHVVLAELQQFGAEHGFGHGATATVAGTDEKDCFGLQGAGVFGVNVELL